MGIEIDHATRQRLVEIEADTSGVDEGVKHTNEELAKIPKYITINVSPNIGKLGWEGIVSKRAGGIVGYADGGIAGLASSIAGRVQVPSFDAGGVLAMLHPPEVVLNEKQAIVLNEKQALKALWNMANMPMEGKSGVVINNTFNSPKPLTESEIKRNTDITARELGYRMGIN